jgi:hypothetical protein
MAMACLLGVLLCSAAAAAQNKATITLQFRNMGPHAGLALALRVVDTATGAELDRLAVPEIPTSPFDLEIEVAIGGSYQVDFFIDINDNGRYDAPPTDRAWRLLLTDVQESGALAVDHSLELTDIDWPPRIDGRIEKSEYRNALFDSVTDIELYWQNADSTLFVGLVSPGIGWVAIGFDPERKMQGANIIIAAIIDGELTIEDHFGSGQTSHRADPVSQILAAAGIEEAGETSVEFAIPLAGGGDGVDLEPGATVTTLLAYHETSDRLTSHHSKRSTIEILLDN